MLKPSEIKIVDHPDLRPLRIEPVSFRKLRSDYPQLRPVVIDGVLRKGETLNLIAAAKVGKSFSAGGLAWSIATGTPWLGHYVVQGRVLVIDNELHPETLANRLQRIAEEMHINLDEFGDFIDVISLRGQAIDIHAIQSRLSEIEPGTYTIAILDALYRTIPSGTSENDNAAMMNIYNKLDYYANQWDTSIVVVHHASKGSQGDKSITDVGSGAGSISRAADTHIVIRPHEAPELSVMECVTRSFKSPDPISIRFDWPLWTVVDSEPVVKSGKAPNAEKRAKDDSEADVSLMAALNKAAKEKKWLSESQLVRKTGMGPARVARAIGRAVSSESIRTRKVPRQGKKVTVYTPTATQTATPIF